MSSRSAIKVMDRKFPLPSWLGRTGKGRHPLVVVCLDGHDPAYMHALTNMSGVTNLDEAKKVDAAPSRPEFTAKPDYVWGHDHAANETASEATRVLGNAKALRAFRGKCAMPSFTNPNNVSIITGQPPNRHGICGNWFIDETGNAVPMNQPQFIRGPGGKQRSFLAAFHAAGYRVGAITSKHKLLGMLKNFPAESPDALDQRTIDKRCFSIEKQGVDVYTAEASLAVFRRAVDMQKSARTRCDVLYLSTTDFLQHKHAPFEKDMIGFYNEFDGLLHKLRNQLGCVVGVTADHGMSRKSTVVYLGDRLQKAFKSLKAEKDFKVVLPITDPYVAHHAALGSFAWVHLGRGVPKSTAKDFVNWINGGGCGELRAVTRKEASTMFELPADRIGDVVVYGPGATCRTAIGSYAKSHDLSALRGKELRTHGGIGEQDVPVLVDKRLKIPKAYVKKAADQKLRNFDIFPMMLRSEIKA